MRVTNSVSGFSSRVCCSIYPHVSVASGAFGDLPPQFRHGLTVSVKALLRTLLIAIALICSMPSSVMAHEVPQRVAVIAYVKPDGQRLRVVVRVPLESMRDMQFAIRPDGTLDLQKLGLLLSDAAELWVANYVDFYENGRKTGAGRAVAVQLSLPSDRSFTSFDAAVAHVHGAPLPIETQLQYQRAMLDMELEYPIRDENARFAMQSGLSHLGVKTTTVLHFLAPGKADRAFEYDGNPGLVQLDPRWYQAGLRFVTLGVEHILTGFDHLLFIFCLVIPVRRWRVLASIVTAFTAAHSITLVASAYGFAPNGSWFPPLVESLIAVSIVYMALENILGRPERLNNRWMLAFGFGLVHGFGFSFALRESLQFAGTHLITSLAAFNIGVELGQLFVLALALPLLALVIRKSASERAVVIVASALVAHSGWHWMTDRLAVLSAYRVSWPTFDAVLLLGVMRALLAVGDCGCRGVGIVGRDQASDWRAYRRNHTCWTRGRTVMTHWREWCRGALACGLSRAHIAVADDARVVPAHEFCPPSVFDHLSTKTCWSLLVATCLGLAVSSSSALAQSAGRSTKDRIYTSAQAAEGRDIYDGRCKSCHTAISHTGPPFRANWDKRPLSDLWDYILEKMPKDAPGTLDPDEYTKVLAYILRMNGMPAGQDDLSSDKKLLKTIRIDAPAAKAPNQQ